MPFHLNRSRAPDKLTCSRGDPASVIKNDNRSRIRRTPFAKALTRRIFRRVYACSLTSRRKSALPPLFQDRVPILRGSFFAERPLPELLLGEFFAEYVLASLLVGENRAFSPLRRIALLLFEAHFSPNSLCQSFGSANFSPSICLHFCLSANSRTKLLRPRASFFHG